MTRYTLINENNNLLLQNIDNDSVISVSKYKTLYSPKTDTYVLKSEYNKHKVINFIQSGLSIIILILCITWLLISALTEPMDNYYSVSDSDTGIHYEWIDTNK